MFTKLLCRYTSAKHNKPKPRINRYNFIKSNNAAASPHNNSIRDMSGFEGDATATAHKSVSDQEQTENFAVLVVYSIILGLVFNSIPIKFLFHI